MSLRQTPAAVSTSSKKASSNAWNELLAHPPSSVLTHVERRIDVDYRDRTDLIVGGCKPVPEPGPGATDVERRNAKLATGCYDNWLNAFINQSLNNGTANTIIMLSVGNAVLELSAIKEVIRSRAENGKNAITHVLLIDPYTSDEARDQVKTEFGEMLLGVKTEYFTTTECYQKCFAYLLENPNLLVSVVGGINFGYTLSTHTASVFKEMNEVIEFSQQMLAENNIYGVLHVVTGFQDQQGEYVIRNELSVEFTSRIEKQVLDFQRLVQSMR